MVLLTAGLRPANPRDVKLQCLEGWHGLVHALADKAPVQLGGIINQVPARVGGGGRARTCGGGWPRMQPIACTALTASPLPPRSLCRWWWR